MLTIWVSLGLAVSFELSIRFLARATESSRLEWNWRIHFQAHSCGCWQASEVLHPSSLPWVPTVGMLT